MNNRKQITKPICLPFHQSTMKLFKEQRGFCRKKEKKKKSDEKSHSRRSIFGSIKVEKLTAAFGAIFNLFGHHEIHETALAPGHNQNMVFMVFLYPVMLSGGRWGLRRRLLAVVWAVVFWVEISAVFCCGPRIFFCFHAISPVYIVNLPCLPKTH